MCGLFGILSTRLVADQVKEQIYKGIAQLEHRGPDGWGAYFADQIAMGHTRLSIFDASGGNQPMVTERSAIVYNGEIYNHLELRQELLAEGVIFRTSCDTEVLQRLYEREGIACLAKLNGQFAFLLWDKQEKVLIAARDRLGMRPLYVFNRAGALYFSSEMKAFDAVFPGAREMNPPDLLEHGLVWNTLGDRTVYKGIRSVESGTVEIYTERGEKQVHRYYQIGENSEQGTPSLSFEDACEAFDEQLNRSVELRLRSDVPVGAYLSGGIDSTVIAQLTENHNRKQFRTFSVEFDDARYDEGHYQRLAAERISSLHDSIRISHASISDNFLESIYHTERPVFRTAPIPLYLLSQKVRETNTVVVLTGEGADEILCGYDSFKELKLIEHWKQQGPGKAVDDAIAQLYPHLNYYADTKKFGLMRLYYEGFLQSAENNFAGLNIRIKNNTIIQNYLNKAWDISCDEKGMEERLRAMQPKGYANWSILQKNTFLEIKTLLQGYLLSSQGDRMALANSIEGRYPFLDHNLIEFVFSLPDEYKLKGFSQKYLLRKTYSQKIPAQIVDRPKRPYTAPDVAAFYRGNRLVDFAAELLSDKKIEEFGCFNPKMVRRLLKKFSSGVPESVGYRDNMLFIFVLSTQACQYWINSPRVKALDLSRRRVEINERSVN